MTAREIGPHTRPTYDLLTSRPRAATSVYTPVASRHEVNPHGETCVVRFYKQGTVVFEETSPMIAVGGARAVYTAVRESMDSWRNQARYSPAELRKREFSTNPDDWDEAEVNSKRFPRPPDV